MQTITNEKKVARGAQVGKIATFAGLGFLVVGLIISLALKDQAVIWVSFVCLLLGLIISSIGTMNMNRWVKQPRADEALEQGLKGFDDRYRLYNYYLPVPHVLLSPMGLYVLTALGQDGVIRFEGEKLHRDFSLGRLFRFMAEEGIGRPFAEAAHEVQKLRQFLAAQGVGEEVEIQSMLVFYSPRAELVVSDPPLPVVNPKGIKKTIRKQQSDKLPGSQYRQLQEVFDAAVE